MNGITAPGDRIAPFALPPYGGGPVRNWRPGRVTVLCFCALWCDTWRAQSARLLRVQHALAGLPVDFLTVSVDGRWSERFATGSAAGVVLLDVGSRLSAQLGVRAVPYTFVVDREGVVRVAAQGVVRAEELTSLLRSLALATSESSADRSVYVTFDGFPVGGGVTGIAAEDDALLDALRAVSVPTTLFCVWSRLREPGGRAAALRALREGHCLQVQAGNTGGAEPEIARCADTLRGLAPGCRPTLYRRPGTSAVQRLDGTPGASGRRVIDPYDDTRPGQAELLRRVLWDLSAGAVIQLHAGVEETLRALPAIADTVRRRNLRFALLR